MLIIRCQNANSAERELMEQLEHLDGVAIIGYTVNNNGREREIDAILLTPVRAAVIEAKAPKMATPSVGELIPQLNSPWTIGGENAQFYGGHSPNDQARLNAQILAQLIKSKKVPRTPFIQSAVSVSGDELTMTDGPQMVGQTAVGLVDDIIEALDMMKQKPITLNMALGFIDALDLGVFAPNSKDVEREWKHSDEMFDSIPKEKAVVPASVKSAAKKAIAPYPPDEEKTRGQLIWLKMVDLFTAFIAIFLLTFFLDGMGIIDYTKEAFREIFVGDTTQSPDELNREIQQDPEPAPQPQPTETPSTEVSP